MIDDETLMQTTCPIEMLTAGSAMAMRPAPDSNPKTKFGLQKTPLRLVPPSAIAAEAHAFLDGAGKYGPFNWRVDAVSAGIYYEAALRHLFAWFDGEENARDSGVAHLAHARACIAILIDAEAHGKLIDNRPNTAPDLL